MLSRLFDANPRVVLLAFAVFCFGSVGLAVTLGAIFDLEACSMCWFQRISFLIAGAGFLLAAAWPRGAIVTRRLAELGLLIGFASAARQSWLLIHPEQASGSCGAGLMYYLKIGAYDAFFNAGLVGGVECASDQPMFLGLHLPQWSLLAFIIVGMLYLVWSLRPRRA